jgi:small subunit ribosomal protein S1
MSDSTSVPNSSQSFSMEDFENALQEYDYEFTRGQRIQGTVVQITSEGAYVDIGGKSPAFVPTNEAALGFVNNLEAILPVGETKEFLIIREQDDDGQVTLSIRQLALDEAWADIKEMAETGKSTQIRVTGVNKGGVMGEVSGLKAFIPRSHLQQRDSLDSLVGQLLTATFLEVNQENRKLVLSQRDAMRAVAMNRIDEGTLMPGKIVNIKPYGVFVDLDGATGLLHVKEISGARVESLNNLFEVGQKIKVVIKQIDEHQNRLSLSIKALESYPGENIEKLDEVMANAESRWEQAQRPSTDVTSPQENQPKATPADTDRPVAGAETAPEETETTQSEN